MPLFFNHSANELGTVMKSVGYQPTEADVAKLIKKADSDGSGVIEFEEFVEMMGDYEVIGEEDIISAFKMFDRNGDGTISAAEFQNALIRMNIYIPAEVRVNVENFLLLS